MNIQRSHHTNFKTIFYLFLGLLFLFSTLSLPQLEAAAAKCGKTKNVDKYRGIPWTEVYIKSKKLVFSALMPNCSGISPQSNLIHGTGHSESKRYGYLIETTVEDKYNLPDSEKSFIDGLKRSYGNFKVKAIHKNTQGAIYTALLTPNNKSEKIHWLLLATKGRLFKLGTDDPNKARRSHFFDSASIK